MDHFAVLSNEYTEKTNRPSDGLLVKEKRINFVLSGKL